MKSTQKRKPIVFALTVLSIAATMATVMWLFMPRERLLTDLAHPVVAVDTSPVRATPKEQVYWLNPGVLLIITTEHDSYGTDDWNGINDWTGHADLYDTGKRTRYRLVGLTYLLNRPGRFHGSHPSDFQLSPTGTRLYWSAFLPHRLGAVYASECGAAISTLEGKELREWRIRLWPVKEGRPRFWVDDQHFAEVMWDWNGQLSHLRIHDARNSHGDRTIASSSPETSHILARYADNRPLLTSIDCSNERPPKITRQWFDVRSGQIVNHTDIVSRPKGGGLEGWPDQYHQTTAPFTLVCNETPLLMEWLHRYIPAVPVEPVLTEGLWISRAGTGHMQELGHILMHPDKNDTIVRGELEQIRCLPDGNQISFIYRKVLYILPVVRP